MRPFILLGIAGAVIVAAAIALLEEPEPAEQERPEAAHA